MGLGSERFGSQGLNPYSSFERFFMDHERPVRLALSALLGFELGREAAAEAFAYAWEQWSRVSAMVNAAGYVYRVGRNYGVRQLRRDRRRLRWRPAQLDGELPWVEPALSRALLRLSDRQRVAVVLVHGLGWRNTEVAALLGISPTTVKNHVDRALARLRVQMEVSV